MCGRQRATLGLNPPHRMCGLTWAAPLMLPSPQPPILRFDSTTFFFSSCLGFHLKLWLKQLVERGPPKEREKTEERGGHWLLLMATFASFLSCSPPPPPLPLPCLRRRVLPSVSFSVFKPSRDSGKFRRLETRVFGSSSPGWEFSGGDENSRSKVGFFSFSFISGT